MERIFYLLLIVFALVLLFHSWLLVSLSMKSRELEKRVHQLQRKQKKPLREPESGRKLLQGGALPGSEEPKQEQQKKGKRTKRR